MSSEGIAYLLFTLLAIFVQGVFALFEMAAVSFNKIRLQYYVSIGKRRAIWLERLLKSPSRLFGTTLLGISTALQVGSECSRRFYESIHLDPDWSPITQVFIVVILAELAPMFAARRHPEQIAMGLVPIISFLGIVFRPITWMFDALSRFVHRLMGKSSAGPLFFSRDEVKMAFEERDKGVDEWNMLVRKIFQLKNLTAGQLMTPLSANLSAPSTTTLAEARALLSVHFLAFLPIYHRHAHNIVGVAQMRHLLHLGENQIVLEAAKSPWFVPKETSILDILEQFRRNNQSVAVILDPSGQACGILSLDQIIDEIFGVQKGKAAGTIPSLYIERTLAGEMLVSAFNRQFQATLSATPYETLSDLVVRELGHPPAKDETVEIGSFVFFVLEPTLRGVKVLTVRTIL